jgi:hypothetical protein
VALGQLADLIDNQMLYNWILIVHVPSHNSLC